MRTILWILALALPCAAWAQENDLRLGGKPDAQITITSPSSGMVLTSSVVNVSASFTGPENGKIDSIELRVNGSGVAATDIPKKTRTGTHVFPAVNLSAYDNTGTPVALVARAYLNPSGKKFVDSAAVLVTVSSDHVAPLVTLLPANGGQVLGPRPTLSVSYSDSPAGVDLPTFRATLDGADVTATFVKGASSAAFTPVSPIADGPHILRIELADKVGNLAQASSVFRVESALATIGDQGGTLEITDPTLAGVGAKLVIPPGAVSQEVVFSIESVPSPTAFPEGYAAVGPILDFFPNITFTQPATIAIPYDAQVVSGLVLPLFGLRLLTFDVATGMWIRIPVLSVDTVNHLLISEVTGINGQQFGVAGQVISPSESSVQVGGGQTIADGLSFATLTVIPRGHDGSLAGPNQTLVVYIDGVSATGVSIADLGNGAYEVYIGAFTSGIATVQIYVNDTALPPQSIQFTPKPAFFTITGITSPIAAGVLSNLTIEARGSNGLLVTSFSGTVEINLTGTRDAADNLIYPDSLVATFTTADAGSLTVFNAALFARSGTQTVSVQYILDPAITGSTSVIVNPGAPAVLTRLSPDFASGQAGSVLPAPLAVRLSDAFGNVIPGAQVQFQVLNGGARFNQ